MLVYGGLLFGGHVFDFLHHVAAGGLLLGLRGRSGVRGRLLGVLRVCHPESDHFAHFSRPLQPRAAKNVSEFL